MRRAEKRMRSGKRRGEGKGGDVTSLMYNPEEMAAFFRTKEDADIAAIDLPERLQIDMADRGVPVGTELKMEAQHLHRCLFPEGVPRFEDEMDQEGEDAQTARTTRVLKACETILSYMREGEKIDKVKEEGEEEEEKDEEKEEEEEEVYSEEIAETSFLISYSLLRCRFSSEAAIGYRDIVLNLEVGWTIKYVCMCVCNCAYMLASRSARLFLSPCGLTVACYECKC